MINNRDSDILPPPTSWSGLTWEQLLLCWDAKMRYGGSPGASRAYALLSLLGLKVEGRMPEPDARTGEAVYLLSDGRTATPRQLSWLAKELMPWFDYPYGDPGEPAVKDEKGKVVKEARDPVRGYVSPMRDAMVLPAATVKMGRRVFSLPGVCCNNLTWQQYRSLQATVGRLFTAGIPEDQAVGLQAQFLAHITVPRSLALVDTTGGSIRLRLHWEYRYDTERAEQLEGWWRRQLEDRHCQCLYHVCLQTYQTALTYYSAVYPLLFSGGGKSDPLSDALTGEVGTINTVMKYAGYSEQQQVYDSNLPFVFDILNTMTKEAKEIERMNARIRKK